MNVLTDLKYSLPLPLLNALELEQAHKSIAPDSWTAFVQLATRCATERCVGEWNGQPVRYELLEAPATVRSVFNAIPPQWKKHPEWQSSGWAEIEKQQSLLSENFDRQAQEIWLQRAAYAGWLLTEPRFIDEHDGFFRRYLTTMSKFHLPEIDSTTATKSILTKAKTATGKGARFASEYLAFLARWNLTKMAGPYLPEPLPPLNTLRPGAPVPPSSKRRSTSAVVVDINALKLMSPQQRDDGFHMYTQSPDHLRGWSKIVATSASRRVQLQRYARLLRVRHYWFVLHQTFHDALGGKSTSLKYGFARFFFPKESSFQKAETITKDLQHIRRRLLDREWATKHSFVTSAS